MQLATAPKIRTAVHELPLLASFPWPPHSSTQVFWLAVHHVCLSFMGTEPGSTEQQGMGVWNCELEFCAEAKPAKAEAATMRVE